MTTFQQKQPEPRVDMRQRLARWGQWSIVVLAGALAWTLFILAAVFQGPYLILLFPCGWCVYVAVRQFLLLRDSPSA